MLLFIPSLLAFFLCFLQEDEIDDDDDNFINVESFQAAPGLGPQAPKDAGILESAFDAAEWRMEVERVLPQLKVHIRSDHKVKQEKEKKRNKWKK
mgnify:CR=1 FL=1